MDLFDEATAKELIQGMKELEKITLGELRTKYKARINLYHKELARTVVTELKAAELSWDEVAIIGVTLLMVALAATETEVGRKYFAQD